MLYLVKFIVTTGICWGLYKTVLSHRKTFVFNRIFLLITMVGALVSPLIRIPLIKSAIPTTWPSMNVESSFGPSILSPVINDCISQATIVEVSHYTIMDFFMVVYLTVSFLLFSKFLVNLIKHIRKTRMVVSTTVCRLKIIPTTTLSPYSFFNYLFVPDSIHKKEIPNSIIQHELCHARQLHTLDLIFIEIITVAAWFNPFVYGYKRALRDNHEYTADQYAISTGNIKSSYVECLVRYALGPHHIDSLSLSFSTSSTKKRIKMITETSSKFNPLHYGLIVFIVASLLLSCTDLHEEVEISNTPITITHYSELQEKTFSYTYLKHHVEAAEKLGLSPSYPFPEYRKPSEELVDRIENNSSFYVKLDGIKIENTSLRLQIENIASFRINGIMKDDPL